ncbi:hypothetical protein [Niallia taxi]|uniref:hypothetical protein n=1 Tax=Niallia taxi TaxID=2499688 RepID=UPI0015F59217|nr:hypothetical protein [Niallia taxi]
MEEFEYSIGDYFFKIDTDHSVIDVKKHDSDYGNIPNNYNREITKGEFLQLVHHYTLEYIKY